MIDFVITIIYTDNTTQVHISKLSVSFFMRDHIMFIKS